MGIRFIITKIKLHVVYKARWKKKKKGKFKLHDRDGNTLEYFHHSKKFWNTFLNLSIRRNQVIYLFFKTYQMIINGINNSI